MKFQKLASLKKMVSPSLNDGETIVLPRSLVLNDIRTWDSRLPGFWLEVEIHTG